MVDKFTFLRTLFHCLSHVSRLFLQFYFTYFQLLELFGCGTACVVSPVNRIHYMGEDISIPTMKQHNPIFQQLKTELTDIQYGRKDHPWAVAID